ncbi:hypothetical protein GW17_00051695 [Ensete ventricosum]|nr:hypothetical protein GW17_00051695 [Ensete ventricosum]
MQREWSSSFNSRDGPSDHAPLGKERFTTNTYVPPSTSGEAAYCPPVPDPSQHLLLPQYFNPAAFAAAATAVGVSGVKVENSYMDASRTTTSSRASISISNASDLDLTEWVENDEPGVWLPRPLFETLNSAATLFFPLALILLSSSTRILTVTSAPSTSLMPSHCLIFVILYQIHQDANVVHPLECHYTLIASCHPGDHRYRVLHYPQLPILHHQCEEGGTTPNSMRAIQLHG